MASEITRPAPCYSDNREKHAAVKGLSPGDVLECRTVTRLTKALATGRRQVSYTHEGCEVAEPLVAQIHEPRKIQIARQTVQVEEIAERFCFVPGDPWSGTSPVESGSVVLPESSWRSGFCSLCSPNSRNCRGHRFYRAKSKIGRTQAVGKSSTTVPSAGIALAGDLLDSAGTSGRRPC